MIDVGPEVFLTYDLKCTRIFRHDCFEDSFILEEIHTAGRVDHLSSYFQGYYACIEEFLLEACYGFYIFDMPVLGRVGSLIESAFSTTRSIEKDTIKYFWRMSEILPRIERDSDIHASHAIEILEELRYPLTSWFIRDDKGVWIHFCQLSRLSTRACSHIEYEKIF